MAESASLHTLAQWLSGEFENRAQAQDQPVWFVHLRLWHRPLPHRLNGHLAIFAEQANALKLDQPYRQRIMVLSEASNHLQVQYLAFRQPSQFRGAGANPEQLASLTWDELEHLPGCALQVTQQNGSFRAKMPPDACCHFQYEGQTRQVALGFEARATEFDSYDKGIDPETGSGLWGALMGPYQFQKQQDWSSQLSLA